MYRIPTLGAEGVSSDLNSRISADSVSATTKAIFCCPRLSQALCTSGVVLPATMAMFGGMGFGLRWLPRDLVRRNGQATTSRVHLSEAISG